MFIIIIIIIVIIIVVVIVVVVLEETRRRTAKEKHTLKSHEHDLEKVTSCIMNTAYIYRGLGTIKRPQTRSRDCLISDTPTIVIVIFICIVIVIVI